MEQSNLKNMVILKDIPSNIIEEAIIILKENKKAKRLEKIETKEGTKKQERTNDYILKEAEMFVNSYVSKIEQKKKTKSAINKKLERKCNRLKNYAGLASLIILLETIMLIIR